MSNQLLQVRVLSGIVIAFGLCVFSETPIKSWLLEHLASIYSLYMGKELASSSAAFLVKNSTLVDISIIFLFMGVGLCVAFLANPLKANRE